MNKIIKFLIRSLSISIAELNIRKISYLNSQDSRCHYYRSYISISWIYIYIYWMWKEEVVEELKRGQFGKLGSLVGEVLEWRKGGNRERGSDALYNVKQRKGNELCLFVT